MLLTAQTLAAVLGCIGLWLLYRFAARIHPWAAMVISAGLLARLLSGLFLFWVSYLELPIARSLQLGEGYWFFGVDGRGFMQFASGHLADGPAAILFIDKTTPAFFHVQVLGLGILLFGAAPSVSLLLNSAMYLGAAAIVARLGVSEDKMTTGGKIALVVLSLTPTALLWSTQPMKESLFAFCVVLFLFRLARFRSVVEANSWAGAVSRSALMSLLVASASLYAVASIRWYFGLMLWGAGTLALLIMLAPFKERPRLRPVVVTIAVVLISSQVLVAGSGPYMPGPIRRMFTPSTSVYALLTAQSSVSSELDNARQTQEKVRGRTTYDDPPPAWSGKPSGQAVARAPRRAKRAPVARAKSRAQPPAETKPAQRRPPGPAMYVPPLAKSNIVAAGDFNGDETADVLWRNHVTGEVTLWIFEGSQVAVSRVVSRVVRPTTVVNGVGDVDGDGNEDVAWRNTTRGRQAVWLMGESGILAARTVGRVPRMRTRISSAEIESVMARAREIQVEAAGKSAGSSKTPDAAAGPPPAEEEDTTVAEPTGPATEPEPAGPPSRLRRVLTGLIALTVPTTISSKLGLLNISDGRGLLLFAEIDTLIFDAVLLVALYYAIRAVRRRVTQVPLFWPLVALTIMTTIAIAYVSTNYGTLLRHRAMILLCLGLLPLVVSIAERERLRAPSGGD